MIFLGIQNLIKAVNRPKVLFLIKKVIKSKKDKLANQFLSSLNRAKSGIIADETGRGMGNM